jgi:ketosteroid isomerase-like protein
MSREENARRFREGMEAYSRGDWDAALVGFHPDVEWSAETDLVPDAAATAATRACSRSGLSGPR